MGKKISSGLERTISVSGAGSVSVQPDVAEVTIGVEITRPSAKDARAAAAAAMTAVVAAVRNAGVADKDVRTDNLNLGPVFDYDSPKGPRLTGYQFSNTLRITVRQLETLPAIIDETANIGATVIRGVSFAVLNREAAEAAARALAMRDARIRADALAKLAGVSITGVASVSESAGASPAPMGEMAMLRSAKADPTPIEMGSAEVSVHVDVRYLID
jgi:uncharacterized protein YggE